MSGSGISWAICKSAPRSRQITTPVPLHSVFYRPDALPATHQQRQSTEGTTVGDGKLVIMSMTVSGINDRIRFVRGYSLRVCWKRQRNGHFRGQTAAAIDSDWTTRVVCWPPGSRDLDFTPMQAWIWRGAKVWLTSAGRRRAVPRASSVKTLTSD